MAEIYTDRGDIGPECLQSDGSYSLDTFGDIDALIVDLPDFAGTPPRKTECLRTIELSREALRSSQEHRRRSR